MLGPLAALALAGFASASPVAVADLQARENNSPFVSPAGLNVTYQSPYNS
jgi:L-asparaginase